MCCCKNNSMLPEDFVVFGHQITNGNEYRNPLLLGRYKVELRGLGKLIKNVEWNYLDDGGFKILIPGFNATNDVVIIIEFY